MEEKFLTIPKDFIFKTNSVRDIKLILYLLYAKNSIDSVLDKQEYSTFREYNIEFSKLYNYLGKRSKEDIEFQLSNLCIDYIISGKCIQLYWDNEEDNFTWDNCYYKELFYYKVYEKKEYVLLKLDEVKKISSMREWAVYFMYRRLINFNTKMVRMDDLNRIANVTDNSKKQNKHKFKEAIKRINDKLMLDVQLDIR